VFENIKSLRPYFFSLREIENNVSLDIKIPLSWKYDEIIKPYRILNIKIQDKNDKHTLLSLISNATQNGYDVAFACANEIIKLNKEEEEKQRLFQEKVKELQELFKNQSLDKLKDINLLKLDGQEDTTSIELVEEGDREGSEGSGEVQESDN
jgi:hypothetical protein